MRTFTSGWQLRETDFDPEPFVFEKHADLPVEECPAYRLADMEMTINVWEKQKVVDTVTLRAIVVHDPQGEKPAERWPVVLFTDDRQIDAILSLTPSRVKKNSSHCWTS